MIALRIGDYITLKHVKKNETSCFLSTEGIFSTDIVAVENIASLDDGIFCVHLQRQYSSARELEEFLTANKIDGKSIQDPQLVKYYRALKVLKELLYSNFFADNYDNLSDLHLEGSR